MPRNRTRLKIAGGRLVSAVQKVWLHRIGTEQAATAEAAMNRAHVLLEGIREKRLKAILDGKSPRDYLGRDWVSRHATVERAVGELEAAIKSEPLV
jgi:hypothetical protein